MTYSVKEMYLTLQGEGVQTGITAIFLRFSGCNLWSGLERDRASAICNFCDTDFIGTNGVNGGKFKTAETLAHTIDALWFENLSVDAGRGFAGQKWVVCTGGEPLLQLDAPLIEALHSIGFKVAVETNGTLKAPEALDWVCVSPKANAKLKQVSGDELKLVFPQIENKPTDFEHLDFTHFCLQPLDNKDQKTNIQSAITYCLSNPKWRLSLQTHKITGID